GELLVEDIGDAVNRLSGVEPPLVIGPGVALAGQVGLEAAPLLIDVAEGVVDVRQLARHLGGVQILHLEVPAVDAPLGEVCDRLIRPDRRWCRCCRRRRRRRRGSWRGRRTARADTPPWPIDAGIGLRILVLSPPLGFVDEAVQTRALAAREDRGCGPHWNPVAA